MNNYILLREDETLEPVLLITADTYVEAKEKARELGYDMEHFRIEDAFEEW